MVDNIPECHGCAKRFEIRCSALLSDCVPKTFSDVIYGVMNYQQRRFEEGNHSIDTLRTLCLQLVELGFSRTVEEATTWVVFERIDELVSEKLKQSIYKRSLPELIEWVNNFIDTWISSLLPPPTQREDISGDGMKIEGEDRGMQISCWRKRLLFYLNESVCTIRTKQILQLIKAFPDCTPALEDLKDAISCTDQKPVVTRCLREQFGKSMLNAGTVTADILQQYVNMIRTLRFLDPTGVILENVSDPVRDYLRRRPDTVRCIVSEMTGDGDLYRELERGRVKGKDNDGDEQMDSGFLRSLKIRDQEDEDCLSIDGDYDADGNVDPDVYSNWVPDPMDAPLRDGKWKSGGDAIATLVAIYGSSEQIVNEYKGLLADKLVSNFELELEREGRILGLLTERFGKNVMHDCSIMLKDVQESRKGLQAAHKKRAMEKGIRVMDGFETTVISKEFWPKLVEEPEFKMGREMEEEMKMFEETFKEVKAPRKLRWQHGIGVISICLQFEDGREIQTEVTPLQASMLSHFAENSRQDIDKLSERMGIDSGLFRRKIQSLASMGIIRATDASNRVYETVEHGDEVDGYGGYEEEMGDGDEGEAKDEDEMSVYETYILAMLQNLKQLPLERIHTMLKMFVQTPSYDKTQGQLAGFLQQLVGDGKVEVSAGMYRIKK